MTAKAPSPGTGTEIHRLIRRLFPICRSITGEGLRETLRILQERIPLEVKEVPSGTRVFDWEVPKEWNIRGAAIRTDRGDTLVDFSRSNLHVMGYSVPVKARMDLDDLRPHLHTLPERPDWIPYKTSYYRETWGFCLPHRTLETLQPGMYEVEIDSTLEAGSMSYGELLIPGEEPGEVLISTHACHPSMCNDNLSGVAVSAFLADYLGTRRNRLSYRFLFLPGTIGAITWLALNQERVSRIQHGLVLSCLGDPGRVTYKKSRRGDAPVDQAAAHALAGSDREFEIKEFTPYGYDERQYCSPGFNLPVGSLTRTPWGEFPEYHTSADDLGLVTPDALEDSLRVCQQIVGILEDDVAFVNTQPMCEPRLGSRGLWQEEGGGSGPGESNLALLWVLNMSDGHHTLLEIAERSGMRFGMIRDATEKLRANGLLRLQPSMALGSPSVHNRPPRVCHLMSGDLWAGAEAQLLTLLGALRQVSDVDLSVVLLNEGPVADEVRRLGVPLMVIPEDRHHFFSVSRRLRKGLEAHPPDILHSHRYKENALAAMMKSFGRAPRLVQTVHGFSPAHPGSRGLKEILLSTLDNRVAVRAFDHVVAVSAEIRDHLRRFVRSENVSVIHNGVDLARFDQHPPISNLREELGIGPSHLLLGVMGRMVPVKGYDVFLKSLPAVLSAFPQVRAVLVGDGPLLPGLRNLAEALEISGRVIFTGFRPDAQSLVSAMDLFVLSSLHEGIPMVLLEAMAAGRPTVATRVGGVPEVLVHRESGWLVPPDDPAALSQAMMRLLDDPALRRRLGEAGRRRVAEGYSAEQMGRKMEQVYRGLLLKG